MIDIVTNHYAYSGSPEDIDYSIFSPFNDESYFHTYCPIDYEDLTNTVRLPATVSRSCRSLNCGFASPLPALWCTYPIHVLR